MTMFVTHSRASRVLALLLAAPFATLASMQQPDPTRDSLSALVSQKRAEHARAADRFFNARLSPSERVAAVRSLTTFASPAHSGRALDVAFDQSAPLEVRVAALRLGSRRLMRDTVAQQTLLASLATRDATIQQPFRREAVQQLELLLVARPATPADATLRALASDPDPQIRSTAVARLALRGDANARQMLIEGIRQPQRAILPEHAALALLASHPDSAVIALAHQVLTTRPDGPARRTAARIAAAKEPGRRELTRILADSSSPTQLRVVAVQALVVYDAGALSRVTAPILAKESESDSLRVAIIEALRLRGPRPGTTDEADLERRITQLSRTAGSVAVRTAAARFLEERD
jgi:hypothetical protein